jgi:hypothetical protein
MSTITKGALAGVASGVAGAAAMTAASKAEQLLTRRPDSYVRPTPSPTCSASTVPTATIWPATGRCTTGRARWPARCAA